MQTTAFKCQLWARSGNGNGFSTAQCYKSEDRCPLNRAAKHSCWPDKASAPTLVSDQRLRNLSHRYGAVLAIQNDEIRRIADGDTIVVEIHQFRWSGRHQIE